MAEKAPNTTGDSAQAEDLLARWRKIGAVDLTAGEPWPEATLGDQKRYLEAVEPIRQASRISPKLANMVLRKAA